MKKLVIAATVAALMSGTVIAPAMAGPRDHRDNNRYEQQHGRYDNHRYDNRRDHDRGRHHWKRGERVSKYYRSNRYAVRDYRAHRLHRPPQGYQWVRADNDFLLVAVTTGLIASIIAANR